MLYKVYMRDKITSDPDHQEFRTSSEIGSFENMKDAEAFIVNEMTSFAKLELGQELSSAYGYDEENSHWYGRNGNILRKYWFVALV